MAAKHFSRRKVRKPKLIQIQGHRLTQAMHADFMQFFEKRMRTARGDDLGRVEELALGDFLSAYRPSHTISGVILDIFDQTTAIGIAIGKMGDYNFYTKTTSVRTAGCELLKKLALDLYHASAKLTAAASNVEAEEATKLQDWLAQADTLKQIGIRGEGAPHG
jgi:hypothetical protein